jgi:hypothetical protein
LSLAWKLVESYYELRSMRGYLRANLHCDWYALCEGPSKELRKQYGLSQDTNVTEVWTILEMYVKGELVRKEEPKCTVTITEIDRNGARAKTQ